MAFANGTNWDAAKLASTAYAGTANADNLSGSEQNETFYGLAGDDYINGNGGNDVIYGAEGNDTIYARNGTTDKITVQSWFSNPAYRVEKVAFANGTNWDAAKLASTAYAGTANADNLSGSEQNETFYGLAGDDYINGNGGNDVIYGAEGNDTIYARNGNDTLEGGVGNDALYGGNYYYDNSSTSNGNDIYLFNKGDGQDTIYDYDTTTGNIDTIRFGTGILPTEVTLNRDAANLYITLNGTTDKITVQSWFSNPAYRVEKVAFANGTNWDLTKLVIGVSQGTTSADLIVGANQNETLKGLAGNDTVFGYAGNDNLDGGEGNDILIGGIGKDTLTSGLGIDRFDYCKLTDSLLSGFDIIKDFNATTGNDLFRVSTARAGFVKVGAVNTLNAADIGAKLTATAFKSNFAAQFNFGQKTFVAINDATAGFNAATDTIIEVTGLTGTLNVNNFVIS